MVLDGVQERSVGGFTCTGRAMPAAGVSAAVAEGGGAGWAAPASAALHARPAQPAGHRPRRDRQCRDGSFQTELRQVPCDLCLPLSNFAGVLKAE